MVKHGRTQTKVAWPARIDVWRRLARHDSSKSISEAGQRGEIPHRQSLDPRTIRKLKDELKELPHSQATRLTEDIQEYRNELRAEAGLAVSEISVSQDALKGLRKDIRELTETNRELREILKETNRHLADIKPYLLGSTDVPADTTLMTLTTVWTGRFRGPKPGWNWDHAPGARGTLKLDVEDDPMFPMLREHLADRSFGRLFDEWKRSVEYLLWLCRELSSEMTLVCQRETGASVLKAGARSRNTLFWEFCRQIYRRQLLRAEGGREGPYLDHEVAQSGDLWVLKLGNRRLAVHQDQSALSRWRDTHRELVTGAAWSHAIGDTLRQHEEVQTRSRELRAVLRGLS